MDTQARFGFQELLNQLVGEMAKAVSERPGETKEQQFVRFQAATHTIMTFAPRDAIEAMLAGHCVMFHEVLVDSVLDTLRGEANPKLRAARGNVVAMDRAFGMNLRQLEKYQTRVPEGQRDAAAAVGETEIGDRVRRHQAENQTPAAAKQGGSTPARPREAREGRGSVGAGRDFVGGNQGANSQSVGARSDPRVKPEDDEPGAEGNEIGAGGGAIGTEDAIGARGNAIRAGGGAIGAAGDEPGAGGNGLKTGTMVVAERTTLV